MNCERCGNPLDNASIFCPKCGYRVSVGSYSSPSPTKEPSIITAAESTLSEPAEIPVVDTTETPAAGSVEIPADAFMETPVADSAESPAGTSMETPIAEPAERPVADAMDTPAGNFAVPPAVLAPAMPSDDSIVTPADYTSNIPVMKIPETPSYINNTPDMPPMNQADPQAGAADPSAASPNWWRSTNGATPPPPPVQKPKNFFLRWQGILLLSVIAVICASAVVIIANAAFLSNLFRRTFYSPEKYYRYVEANATKEQAEVLLAYYNKILDSASTDQSVDTEMNLLLGESLRSLISFETDISWLEGIGITTHSNIKDNVISVESTLDLGSDDKKLISLNVLADYTKQVMYMQLPELNPQYIGLDLDEYMNDDYGDINTFDYTDRIMDALPKDDILRQLITKYTDLSYENIDHVEIGSETLEIEGISQKFTTLRATMDEETMLNMTSSILTEMTADEDIKKIIYDVAEAAEPGTGEDIYADFLDGVDSMLAEMEYSFAFTDEITITTYVDNKGAVCGRSSEFQGVSSSWIMPRKGSNYGLEFKIETDTRTVSLIGNGSFSGSKLSGEFQVMHNAGSLFLIGVEDYDVKSFKEGNLNGRFSFRTSPTLNIILSSPQISNFVPEEMIDFLPLLANYELLLDFNTQDTLSSGKITIMNGELLFASLDWTSKTGAGETVTLPPASEVTMYEYDEEEALIAWMMDVDWNSYFTDIKTRCNIPSDLIDPLQETMESLLAWYSYDYAY